MRQLPENVKIKWDDERKALLVEGTTKTRSFSAQHLIAGKISPIIVLLPGTDPDEARRKYNIFPGSLPYYAKLDFDGHTVITKEELIEYLPPEERVIWERHVAEIKKLLEPVGCICFESGWKNYLSEEDVLGTVEVKGDTWEIGKSYVRDGYTAQFGHPVGDDDYVIDGFFFDHYPTAEEILTVRRVSHLDTYIMIGSSTSFRCRVCDKVTNWWDIKADSLLERIKLLDDFTRVRSRGTEI